MLFVRRVPLKARRAYIKDVWSGILGNIALGATLPFVAVIARGELNATAFQIGILTSAPVAGSLLSLFWARMMDGHKKMPFLVVPIVISRAMLLFTFFAKGPASFVGLISLLFFIGSISGPAYSAILKEIYPDHARARVMAYVRVIAVGVLVIVTLVAGWLLDFVSYRYVFPIAAIFGIISPLIFNTIPTSEGKDDERLPMLTFLGNSARVLVDNKGFRWFCGGIFVFGTGNFLAAPVYEIYKVDVLGVDTRWQSIYAIITSAMQVVGYLYWGSFIDRQKPSKTIALTTLVWASVPLFFILSTQAWMLIPVTIVSGAMLAAMELSYFNGVIQYAPKNRITQYQAIFQTLTAIRGMIGPFIGSWLLQYGGVPHKVIFAISMGLILIGYAVLARGNQLEDRQALSESA